MIAWNDGRTTANGKDVYAQLINAAGTVQWTANGVPVCATAGDQTSPLLTSDGANGVFILWMDSRSGEVDLYAQRLNSSGVSQWAANGVPVCAAGGNQLAPKMTSDGNGGAIVTWEEDRGTSLQSSTTTARAVPRSTSGKDIYGQRLSGLGTTQWATDGLAVAGAPATQQAAQLLAFGADQTLVVWTDDRNGTSDIYAGVALASGALLPVSLTGFTLE